MYSQGTVHNNSLAQIMLNATLSADIFVKRPVQFSTTNSLLTAPARPGFISWPGLSKR